MNVYQIDPLRDLRWAEFLETHPRASAFHTPRWADALRRTYGYEPVVLTTSAPDRPLTNGLVFCRIHSYLTGRRLVSLPFSDHCEPLVDDPESLDTLTRYLKNSFGREHWKYIEIRPLSSYRENQLCFEKGRTFYAHRLDLRPGCERLFRGFHKDCIQRKIRRAERENLSYEEGRSDSLLRKFYGLLRLTRRRQQLPPQPFAWFRNLIDCLGDKLTIRVASKDSQPVASIITLRHRDVLVYKYGCSDARFNNLGGTAFLLWKTIQEAQNSGLQELDMGRSDCDNPGLVAFKDRWGAARSMIYYRRYPSAMARGAPARWKTQMVQQVFACMPEGLSAAAGKLLYRHIG